MGLVENRVVWFNLVWLVWFWFDLFGLLYFILVWFGLEWIFNFDSVSGLPGPPQPPTASTIHNPAYRRPWTGKKEKEEEKEWDIELLRN